MLINIKKQYLLPKKTLQHHSLQKCPLFISESPFLMIKPSPVPHWDTIMHYVQFFFSAVIFTDCTEPVMTGDLGAAICTAKTSITVSVY